MAVMALVFILDILIFNDNSRQIFFRTKGKNATKKHVKSRLIESTMINKSYIDVKQ